MYDNSFTVVQVAQIKRSSIPLVLLHDGGGTIFSYHALGPLNRDVYGISNPRFEDGKAWEGGIHEMAQAYAQMIKAKIPRGKILLGGWSFGGFLALEISYILAQDNDIQVAGLVLIDTPYPKVGDKPPAGANYMPDLPGVRPQLRRRIHSSIQHAKNMVLLWQLPKWEAAGNFEDLEHANSDMSMPRYNRRNNPPPAVLLRATNAMKRSGNNIEPVALVDIARHDPSLGWNQYENTFIEAVWEIPGNHFGLFDAPYVNHVTEKLANACAYLCPETNKL